MGWGVGIVRGGCGVNTTFGDDEEGGDHDHRTGDEQDLVPATLVGDDGTEPGNHRRQHHVVNRTAVSEPAGLAVPIDPPSD